MRRYDIDAIRIIALSLLIFYHIMVAFQPWGDKLYFITNKDSLESIWVFMELINIWRIPILFMVSGMGVQLAMQNRTWGALLGDRTLRIAVPLIFGSFFIVPTIAPPEPANLAETPTFLEVSIICSCHSGN